MRFGFVTALAAVGIATTAPAAPPAPKLIVAISIDQFAWSLFDHYRGTYAAGLKRLAGGIVFTGYQSHAATETCPGHSTILTGRHPAATGIVANTWFDVSSGSSVYCVSVKGTSDPNARGPQNMRVDTFGDWMKQAKPGARVVAISGKDRAAITMAGHHADAVYWWVDGEGFTTSHYAGPATPAVLAPAQAFNKAVFAKWRATPPALWPATISPECTALEKPETFGKIRLSGKVPPDGASEVETGADFLARTDFQDHLRASPTFDAAVMDFAEKVIDTDKLGHGPSTDLLALSFSANDYVGHRYGAGGAEMCVQQAAIDRTLGRLLAKLDSLDVPYMIVLTADHGGIDAAERSAEHGIDAHRIDSVLFVKQLNDAISKKLNVAFETIVGDDPQQLTINVGPDAALKAKVRDAAVAWLKARPEVSKVYTADETIAAVPPPDKPVTDLTFAERFHESYDKERSGDIQVAFAEFSSFGIPRGPGDAVGGHGSPWDYDRRVPILFFWPGVSGDVAKMPIETVDIAPTLAAVTGVPTPVVDGKCIVEVAGVCK